MKSITRISIFSLALIFLISGFTAPRPQEDMRAIVDKMVVAIYSYNTLTFTMKRKERFGTGYNEGKLVGKVQESPRKIYCKNEYPDEGSEVLLVGTTGKALVNPGKFPWVNLNLDPHGEIMMKKQHHSVHEMGFHITGRIIKSALKEHGHDFEKYVSYQGQKNWDGRPCHVLVIDYPKWQYESYTVKAGEDLWKIALDKTLSEFLIMAKNPGISDYSDVKAGQVIQIPNVYSKKSILYIDVQNHLPVVQEVHDEKGMFERYEYTNLKVNPPLKAAEFTEDYDGYGF
ncbi:MAG: DUF1571 domain-containing protein [Bacteroidia bacterium]|nr:DUF1571 domain-containing protein [Bacteroidia bacterium]